MKGQGTPPSRRRYEETHPVVSVRVTKEERERLRAMQRRKISLADVLRAGLNGIALTDEQVAQIRKAARDAGFKAARDRYAVVIPCRGCGKPVVPDGEEWKKNVLAAFEGRMWHQECGRPPQRQVYVVQRPP